MADESESDGVGSEEVADDEILATLEAVEGGGDKEAVDADYQGSLYLKKKKKSVKRLKWKFYKCYLKGSSYVAFAPRLSLFALN